MSNISINIKIANRQYPLKVKIWEEENIRRASKLVNERIRARREKMGVQDFQDLLAIIAFDYQVEKLASDKEQHERTKKSCEKLEELNRLVKNKSEQA